MYLHLFSRWGTLLARGVRRDVPTPLGTLSSVPCSLAVMQQQFAYMARLEGLGRSGAKQHRPGCFLVHGWQSSNTIAFEALKESTVHSCVAMYAKTRSLLTRTHFVCISLAKST
jgi:hypothetical protein